MSHYTEQREADEIWKNAPSTATHYANDRFWKETDIDSWQWYRPADSSWLTSVNSPYNYKTVLARPQTRTKPRQNAQDELKPQNAYQRTIIGLDGSKCVVDVYRVLDAFEVDSHAIAHSIKKLLAPGKRHAKSREQDLREAIASIEAELLLMEQRND